jgi:hypothetical protein
MASLARCARDAATRWCATRIKCARAAHARATHHATSAGAFSPACPTATRMPARRTHKAALGKHVLISVVSSKAVRLKEGHDGP